MNDGQARGNPQDGNSNDSQQTPTEQPSFYAQPEDEDLATDFSGNTDELNTDQVRPYNGKPIISWTASEFVAHSKTFGWYATLAAAIVVLAAVIFLITKDKISTGAIIFCGIILGVFAARKPRQLQYQLDEHGLSIGQKHYNFGDFRSFALDEEDAFANIVLMPLRRFSPLLTIYIDPADEDAIIDLVSAHLPMENHKLDITDRFMKRIRF